MEAKWFDLSRPLADGEPAYPGDPPVRLQQRRFVEKDRYNAFELHTGLHVGTHIDLPLHHVDGEKTVAEYPPEAFTGPGVLLDVRGQDPFGLLPGYGALVAEGDVVLFFTGWDAHYGNAAYYGAHPQMTVELAEFLVAKRVRMVGVDSPSPDRGEYAAHLALMRGGVPILENLMGLAALQGLPAFEVMAFPPRLCAEASPVRVVARAVVSC